MNPTTPSPEAATERFAERFGEISQGLAANGGGDRLSALLIHLIERLIQAILSIARNLPAAAAPVEPDATAFPPKQQHNTPVRPGPSRGHSPRRPEPTRHRNARPPRPVNRRGRVGKPPPERFPQPPTPARSGAAPARFQGQGRPAARRHRPTAATSEKSGFWPGRFRTPISFHIRNKTGCKTAPGRRWTQAVGQPKRRFRHPASGWATS